MNFLASAFRGRIDTIFLLCFSAFLFHFILGNIENDISTHIKHIIKINLGLKAYPPNFLFYLIINILSLFSLSTFKLEIVAIFALSFSVLAKYLISKKFLILSSGQLNNKKHQPIILFIALGLFFFYAIPDPHAIFVTSQMYVGKLVPTVWHNSTTIAVFPFAILLFLEQIKTLESPYETSLNQLFKIGVLVLLNVIIKPSFIFVYIPVTMLFVVFNKKKNKNIFRELAPVFLAIIFIIVQYIFVYTLETGSFKEESSKVVISSPFKFTSHWIPAWNIPIAYIFSLALPIYCLIQNRSILKYLPFIYSILLLLAGILISGFIIETGSRAGHGNFTWQNVICTYLVFLSCLAFVSKKYFEKDLSLRDIRIFLVFFLLHSFSGILYIIKLGHTLKYL